MIDRKRSWCNLYWPSWLALAVLVAAFAALNLTVRLNPAFDELISRPNLSGGAMPPDFVVGWPLAYANAGYIVPFAPDGSVYWLWSGPEGNPGKTIRPVVTCHWPFLIVDIAIAAIVCFLAVWKVNGYFAAHPVRVTLRSLLLFVGIFAATAALRIRTTVVFSESLTAGWALPGLSVAWASDSPVSPSLI